jgi:hypothetical protein
LKRPIEKSIENLAFSDVPCIVIAAKSAVWAIRSEQLMDKKSTFTLLAWSLDVTIQSKVSEFELQLLSEPRER